MSGPVIEAAKLAGGIARLGGEILEEARAAAHGVFQADVHTNKLIEWAMAEEEFRVALFRFVDVLPALGSAAEIIRHAQEYFEPLADRMPEVMRWGLGIEPDSLAARAAAAVVKSQVRTLAERFILGDTPIAALAALRTLRKKGRAFTIDLLGEDTVSEAEAEKYYQRYLELIRTLHREVPTWPESQPLITGHPGEVTPLNISVKLSALDSQARAVSTERTVAVLAERLAGIVREARAHNCFVYVDMERSQFTSIVLATCRRVFDAKEFRDNDQLGLVLQAYLRRTEADLLAILDWLQQRGTPLSIRLVKGAYWDTETIQAQLNGWPIPVWQEKAATDQQYERLSRLLLDHVPLVRPAFGSHNIRSLCQAIEYAAAIGLDPTAYELQMLYGMGEPMKKPFLRRGLLLREYAPIGELITGMGYLVRRLLENTSNHGFLRLGFHAHEKPEQLLAQPTVTASAVLPAAAITDPHQEFHNCPARDFSLEGNRSAVAAALAELSARLSAQPARVRPVIAGQERDGDRILTRAAPEDRQRVVSQVSLASAAQADQALGAVVEYFPVWRSQPVAERAEILFRTAAVLERRRAALAALIILETGKPWTEADADVTEAIDFLHYYALEAGKLLAPRATSHLAGEDNRYFYEPRGVCVVISPWNFPLSIPCGMFSAALVTGNCTVLKPAEQSSAVAAELFRAFQEAGLPAGAAAFLPGDGETIGGRLVASPRTATIAFTGSKDVGLEILRAAAIVQPGQEHVKRVIAEMGSKNAMIIDSDADLDQAVTGVVASAFGYAGQKCSACSRVIVLTAVYDRFLERLAAATQSLVVGPASDPATSVPPVIDEEAQQRLQAAIAEAKRDCRLVAQGTVPTTVAATGLYIPPTVFADIPPGHFLLKKELFGPVLAVVRVPDFAAALQAALDTEYGLTGAVFSRSPRHLQRAAREFRVGNLYLNRGCTGALVGRQPFGGARMSGVGSKAGGPDYLRQFVIPRTVTESTLRKGFAPLEE